MIKIEMKTYLYLPLLLLATFTVHAQSKWTPYASFEENIHFSDVSASLNYLDLSVPAANSGIRLGAFYTHNNMLSGEVTLGITGIGTPESFSSKIVPIEFLGHYNLIDEMELPVISKFNLDVGAGAGLVELDKGQFGLSEHLVLGASAELPSILPVGTVIIGARHTLFLDDYIDGTVVSGSSNDAVLRFFAAIRFDGTSKKLETALMQAESKAEKLKTDQAASELGYLEKINSANTENKKLTAEKTALTVELDAIKASQSELLNEVNIAKSAPSIKKQYHVVIGSFPSQEMAENYAQTIDEVTSIVPVNELSTFRVVLGMHDKLNQALSDLENARKITGTAWIAVN
jgi:hypothetical protein